MRTKKFWLDALERAGMTAAQGLLALIGATQFNVIKADWLELAGIAGGMAFLSVLKSMAASKIGTRENASLVQ